MSGADRRILELEEQVSHLLRIKRELEEKIDELTSRKMFKATLSPDKPLYWIEAQAEEEVSMGVVENMKDVADLVNKFNDSVDR